MPSKRYRVKTASPRRRRALMIEPLEDRRLLTTPHFVQELGVAAQFNNDTTSLNLPITGNVTAGNSIILEFSFKPPNCNTPSIAASIDPTGPDPAIPFSLDVWGCNPTPGGGGGTAVTTVILSLHDTPEIASGSVITLTYPQSDAQAATAAEFSGLAVTNALDQAAGTLVDAGNNNLPVSPSVTTTQDTELLIGAIGVRAQVDTPPPTSTATYDLGFQAGTGYTVWSGAGTPSGNSGNRNSSIHPEYRTVTSVGTYAANGELGVHPLGESVSDDVKGPWAAAIATYRADLTTDFQITAAPNPSNAGESFTITVSAGYYDDYDVFHTSPDFRGTVTFSVSDPQLGEVLPADYTFTTADAGSHTFTGQATLLKTGTRTITVSDTPDCTF